MFCDLNMSFLENVPCALEKNVYSIDMVWNVLYMSLRFIQSIILFKFSVSFLIFCLNVLSIIESRVFYCYYLVLYCLSLPSNSQCLLYIFRCSDVIYIYVCVYIYTHMHIHVCACMYIHTYIYICMYAQSFNFSNFFVTPWTVAHQDPLSMGISQAGILEWVAVSFSRASYSGIEFVSPVSSIGRQTL